MNEEIKKQLEQLKELADEIEILIKLTRKQIYQDYPNADSKIVEFHLLLLRELADEFNPYGEKWIDKIGRHYGKAARRVFEKFYGANN